MSGISIWQLLVILIFIGAIYGVYRFSKSFPPAQANCEGPSGVGGWLLLLVTALMVISPLVGLGQTNANLLLTESQYPNLVNLNEWQTYKSASWWSFIVAACISFYAGYGLAKGRCLIVVKRAIILLWVIGPISTVISDIIFPLIIFGQIEFEPKVFQAIVGSTISSAIWTAYLMKSRRVKATYSQSDESA